MRDVQRIIPRFIYWIITIKMFGTPEAFGDHEEGLNAIFSNQPEGSKLV